MATATAKLTDLLEFVKSDGPKLRVENGIIFGAKILGRESPSHNRSYSAKAITEARPLYEAADVFIDHPPKATAHLRRPFADRVAVIRNVTESAEGLRGDLHVNTGHPRGQQLLWDAEHAADTFGLSHNAAGDTKMVNGRQIVESIPEVRSVDCVLRPATNKNLVESESESNMATKTIKQICEALPDTHKQKAGLAKLIEDGEMPADMPVPVADAGSADDQIKSAFKAMVMAALDDDSLDTAATIAKIKQILQAQDKLMAKPEKKADKPAETTTEGDDTDGDPTLTTLQEEIQQLRVKDEVRTLIESANVTAGEIQIKAAMALPTAADRKTFVESLPKRKAGTNGLPRSGVLLESAADKTVMPNYTKAADLVASMRR